jgi:hypothetical protein
MFMNRAFSAEGAQWSGATWTGGGPPDQREDEVTEGEDEMSLLGCDAECHHFSRLKDKCL